MVSDHEQTHIANPYDDSAQRELIEARQDQGVWNGFMGEVAEFGEGRDQNPHHPTVYRDDIAPVIPLHKNKKPRGTSYPEIDEPDFRQPTFMERTAEERVELHESLNGLKEIIRAKQLIRAANDPAEFARVRAMHRREDEQRGR